MRPFFLLLALAVPAVAQDTLQITSQTWQGQKWTHRISIFHPQKLEFPDAALISLQTNPTPADGFLGQIAANQTGAAFVSLYDVPNQPFQGKKEDELLAYSLEKAYETKDMTWPLVFPMAKSVGAAMTAITKHSKGKIKRFILVGASKRGWAAWLAASDPRVAGLVCIGYNNLNIPKQVENQAAQWGELSPLFKSYSERGLWQKMQSAQGKKVLEAVDPWTIRAKITCPKFVIDSTNNGFWTPDAYNVYADGLKGQTSFLMFPNAGHYMENVVPQLFGSISAWSRRVLNKETWPEDIGISISRSLQGQVSVSAATELISPASFGRKAPTSTPENTRIWFAFSPTHDFRDAVWESLDAPGLIVSLRVYHPVRLSVPPDKPFVAAFAEGEFEGTPQPLHLTSRVLMWDSRSKSPKTP